MLLHCAKVGPDGTCYENCSTFFSLVPRSKDFKNVHLVSTALSQGAESKATTVLETT